MASPSHPAQANADGGIVEKILTRQKYLLHILYNLKILFEYFCPMFYNASKLKGVIMNIWTKRSIDLANQHDYLDQLFKIYPLSANEKRNLTPNVVKKIKEYIDNHDSKNLINLLLDQVKGKTGDDSHPFPIKYSYVSYLKNDRSAIDRNPKTVERIAGYLYDMGLDAIIEKTSAPKETNRQMGPLFKNYIDKKTLGIPVVKTEEEFMATNEDMIFNCPDTYGQRFAAKYLGYNRDKGLDFIARVNNTYLIGETKFLTDFGGHQDAQLNDAIDTLLTPITKTKYKVQKIAIIDGVAYIKSKSKMFKTICSYPDDAIILSSVLLREFLGSI